MTDFVDVLRMARAMPISAAAAAAASGTAGAAASETARLARSASKSVAKSEKLLAVMNSPSDNAETHAALTELMHSDVTDGKRSTYTLTQVCMRTRILSFPML